MGFNVRMLNGVGVGVTARTIRTIKDGKEFDAYFPKPSFKDPILIQNGENENTIDTLIPQIVTTYIDDTKKISEVLKQSTKELTCKRIFDFLYTYVQYHVDAPHEEQIRRPARSWWNRKAGVDCDCYTTFISSCLLNLRIPHYLRMSAYNKERGYQHIYVVVPKNANLSTANRSDYWVIDPVLDGFNTEKPFLFKRDKLIKPVSALNVGVNGFPIRMLNGDNEDFNKRSSLVYSEILVSPELGTWALKGLDGGYYIEGDIEKRYVQPLNGLGIGFIGTGIGVNGGFFKKIGKIAGKALKVVAPIASFIPGIGPVVSKGLNIASGLLSKGGSKPSAPGTPQAESMQQPQSLVPMASKGIESVTPGPDNTNLLTSLIAEKAKQTNNNTILSLMAVDKGLKSKIGDFSTVVNSQVNNLLKQGVTTQAIADKSHEIASKSIEILASTHNDGKQGLDILKMEAQKAEAFRTSQAKTSQITTIVLLGIGLVVLYVAVKGGKISE
ncbi:MAG: hypothetical protein HGA42_00625 [Nostocales cyanobacterium W4_Combined_metabat2_030]|nr:hypothetical protein [Nostocales cyanobacterium W4_Combined_metabat2_030]